MSLRVQDSIKFRFAQEESGKKLLVGSGWQLVEPSAGGGSGSDRRFVSRETLEPIPSNRPLHAPFRPHCVILTHQRSRAHRHSRAVSEESPSFKANPTSTCGDSSSQAPQNDKEKRRRTGFDLNEESFQRKQNEITIVSRETSCHPPHIVPFPCATELPP